jgi:3-dehydroquinate synthetase
LTKIITSCIAHKARVVERDEKESGERKSLNVGHTTGHAIELGHGLSHGVGVLYGMLFETRMAIEKGVCDQAYGEKLLRLIMQGIALSPVENVDFSNIDKDAEKAKMDKKNTDDGAIQMAVAKNRGEWTMFSLPFAEYQKSLVAVSKA